MLSGSVQQLTAARLKFQESSDCVAKQSTVQKNATILVPLTGSMYVPGSVVDNNKFMIDIGTGYFVEKDTTAALEFFTRKIAFLNSRIEEYVRNVQERSFVRQSMFNGMCVAEDSNNFFFVSSGVVEVLQFKQQQMMASATPVSSTSS